MFLRWTTSMSDLGWWCKCKCHICCWSRSRRWTRRCRLATYDQVSKQRLTVDEWMTNETTNSSHGHLQWHGTCFNRSTEGQERGKVLPHFHFSMIERRSRRAKESNNYCWGVIHVHVSTSIIIPGIRIDQVDTRLERTERDQVGRPPMLSLSLRITYAFISTMKQIDSLSVACFLVPGDNGHRQRRCLQKMIVSTQFFEFHKKIP